MSTASSTTPAPLGRPPAAPPHVAPSVTSEHGSAEAPAVESGTEISALEAPLDGPGVPTVDRPSHAPLQAVAGEMGIRAVETRRPRGRGLIARNFLSLGVAAIAGQGVALISNIYASRVLGPDAIGMVSWTAAIISYFALMINPGLETIAKREVAKDPSLAPSFVSTLVVLQVALAIVTFLLLTGFAALQLKGPTVSLLLLFQAISLVLAPLNIGWILHAHERMAILALGDLFVQLMTLPALLLFVHDPSHAARYILLPYPFRLAFLGFTLWYVLHHKLLDWRKVSFAPIHALRNARWLIKEAVPLGLSQVAILIYYNSDSIFLGFLKNGNAAVGYYSRAYRLMTMSTILSSALLASFFPALSRASGDEAASRRSSAEFLRILAWIGFPCSVFGWALGRYVVALLFGPQYAASGPLLEWLSLDIALIFFNVGIGQPLTTWGRQGLVFRITLIGAAVNLGLNFIFIPWLGPAGAVVTTIVAEMAVFVCSIIIRRNIVPIDWLKLIYKPLLCSIAIGVLVKCCAMRFDKTMWPALSVGVVALAGGFVLLERRTALPVLRKIVGSGR